MLQAISSSIVDQTATLVSSHFSRFIYSLYEKTFPLSAPQAVGRVTPRRGRRQLPFGDLGRPNAEHLVSQTHVLSNGDLPAFNSAACSFSPSPTGVRRSERQRLRQERGGVRLRQLGHDSAADAVGVW